MIAIEDDAIEEVMIKYEGKEEIKKRKKLLIKQYIITTFQQCFKVLIQYNFRAILEQ